MIKLEPVVVGGVILLYDIYVDGEWLGSRRTVEQCHQHIDMCRKGRNETPQ